MAWVLPAAAVISAGVATYGAVEQHKTGKRAIKDQKIAQAKAQSDALRQERQSNEAIAAANRKKPNIAALLADSQKLAKNPTSLSGGVQSNSLLGR